MPLFRRRPRPVPGPRIDLRTPPPAPPSPPQTAEDWSDDGRIRAEWTSLEVEGEGRSGWSSGMSLFEQGPVPAQLYNVAEYMTRGLVYTYIGQPLITDELAVETVRRILRAISAMPPTVPAFQLQSAPRLVRLALAVARQKGWQPVPLGGNGEVGEELLRANIVLDSISAPGVSREDYLRHFFSASGAGKAE